MDEENIKTPLWCDILVGDQVNPLNSSSESDCRCGLPTENLHEIVITATGSEGILPSQLFRNELKGGFRIVIKPSYEIGILGKGYFSSGKVFFQFIMVGNAIITQVAGYLRRLFFQGDASLLLAVEYAERILIQPFKAVLTERA